MPRHAIYDALLIAAYADTIVETAEVRSIFDSIAKLRTESPRLRKLLAPDIEEEIRVSFGRVIPAVREAGSPGAAMARLGAVLLTLPRREREKISTAVADMISADNAINFREREVYIAFKNSLKLDSGLLPALRRMFQGSRKRCEQCDGTAVENTCVFELDGWTGLSGITHSFGGSGRGRPPGSGLKRKNCYYWRCNECGAEWEEIRTELRRARKIG